MKKEIISKQIYSRSQASAWGRKNYLNPYFAFYHSRRNFIVVIIILSILLLLSPCLLQAQDHDYYINKELIIDGFHNACDVYTSPVRWNTKDWLKAGIFTGATILLFACDENVQDFVQDHKSHVLTSITDVTNILGDGYFVLPTEALLYCYGVLAKDEKARRISLEMLESFAIVGVTVNGIKFFTHRHRPSASDSPHEWDGPSFSTDNIAFPSGHTCVAFSWATVFAEEFSEKPIVGIVSYTLAACTAFSRVYKNKHWMSDVFVGGLLSHFITKKIVALRAERDQKSITINPLPRGFLISFTF
ncbi:MAG TPA: phosphatase PAP2 family protein [Candidatus Cloacimonetes bacterium]|nr:phosphatase PAP2 family protein [Candidatus Cloacimonadota bacterium]HEX37750.1 phosphatase PAP2 family protein [Candidatus Cloacimonadota bacterium]